jgi:DNA-binding MarR family transcriptional regulator
VSHAFEIASHLERCGVVTKDKQIGDRWFVDLDERFVALPELRRLVLRLAPLYGAELQKGKREKSIGASSRAHTHLSQDPDRLFGTPARTRALLTITAVGEVDQSRLGQLTDVGPQSIRNVVDHWEDAGVVRCRLLGTRKMISLDPTFPAAGELRAFLLRLVLSSGAYGAVADVESRRVERKAKADEPSSSVPDASGLVCIGRRPQARILLALALHGPVRNIDLAAHLGVSPNATKSTGNSLVRLGLVARKTAPGTTVDLWYALDPSHPTYGELRSYLLAIASVEPQKRFVSKRAAPAGFPPKSKRVKSTSRLSRLCGYDMRIRTLVCVFQRPGCEEAEIASALRTRLKEARRHLRTLASRGHITYREKLGVMRAKLNPGYFALKELRNLLQRIVTTIPTYAVRGTTS